MLNEKFLTGLTQAFPSFYARVDDEARLEAERLLAEAGGDVDRALAHARRVAAGRLWWPYVRASVPLVGDDRAAQEAMARAILVVDHVVGYDPGGEEAARAHVLDVLHHTIDIERLSRLVSRGEDKATAAGAGLVASMAALVAPIQSVRRFARMAKWLPRPVKVAAAVTAVAAAASIPIVVSYSAGHRAEKAARQRVPIVRPRETSKPLGQNVSS